MAATRSPTKTVTLVRWTRRPAGGRHARHRRARRARRVCIPRWCGASSTSACSTPVAGPGRGPRFPRDAAATLACAPRLRRDLGLGYAGAVLACELLARIDELEAQLRRYEPRDNRPEEMTWTPTS